MGKAIIKNVDNAGGGTPTATFGSTATAAGVTIMTGTLTDVVTKQDIHFEQPLGSEEGIAVGMKVNYAAVSVNGAMIANSVRLLEKGVVASLNATDDGGTLLNRATGSNIPFYQSYCAASGLAVGSVVNFEIVPDPVSGGQAAVALEVIK